MKATVVMDDFKGRTITDTQIGRYFINGHTPIFKTMLYIHHKHCQQ